jgi:hypothetical protein
MFLQYSLVNHSPFSASAFLRIQIMWDVTEYNWVNDS